MDTGQPEGTYSPRQFATITSMSEGGVRIALRDGRITALYGDFGRRWIPESEIISRGALELTNPITQAATLARLRRNAEVARAELSPDEDLIRNAEAYLRAMTGPAVDEPVVDPWGFDPPAQPVVEQLELAGALGD